MVAGVPRAVPTVFAVLITHLIDERTVLSAIAGTLDKAADHVLSLTDLCGQTVDRNKLIANRGYVADTITFVIREMQLL